MNVITGKVGRIGRGPALALWLILAWGGSAPSVERAMTISELARVADVVAAVEIGKMTSARVDAGSGSFPFLVYEARVRTVIAGACPTEILVRVPGLAGADRIITLPESPGLAPGQKAVLFLRRAANADNDPRVYELVSLSRAVLAIAAEEGGEEVILPATGTAGDGSSRPVRVRLGDLAVQVRAARANSGLKDAQP